MTGSAFGFDPHAFSYRAPSLGLIRLHAIIAIVLLAAVPLRSENIGLDQKDSSVKFTGHAFLHDFNGEATEFSGSAEFNPASSGLAPNAKISITAGKLTTHNKGRDRAMYQWLRVDQNPAIAFAVTRVLSMDGKAALATAEHPAQFMVFGNLTLNKVTKPVQTQVAGWQDGNLLVVTGATQIDTTDYGLPVIKRFWMAVDKEVDINFHLVFDLPSNFQSPNR